MRNDNESKVWCIRDVKASVSRDAKVCAVGSDTKLNSVVEVGIALVSAIWRRDSSAFVAAFIQTTALLGHEADMAVFRTECARALNEE